MVRPNSNISSTPPFSIVALEAKNALKKTVINLIKEKNETADESEIAAVFEEKYPGLSRTV